MLGKDVLLLLIVALCLGPAPSEKPSPAVNNFHSARFSAPVALSSSSYEACLFAVSAPDAETAAISNPGSADASRPDSPPLASTQDAFTSQFNKAMLSVYDARIRPDLEKAVDEFLSARFLNPSSPEVHYNLGLIYLELDEYAEAVDCFSEYLRLAPSAADADKASTLLASARGLQLWMERARRAILNPRSWRLLDQKPAEIDPDWFNTEFRQTKDGQLQIKNPRYNFDLLAGEGETRRNPWLTLNVKGRRFYYYVCLLREQACKKDFGYAVVEGELMLENGRTLVIARAYAIRWKSYAAEYYQKGDLHFKKGSYGVGGASSTAIYELVM